MQPGSSLLSEHTKIETVIWDWNGTLLNDVEINRKIINIMLAKRGLEQLDLTTYKQKFCFPIRQFHSRIGINLEKESVMTISAEYMELYQNHEKEIELSSGASDVLDKLNAQGVHQYILSAAPQNDLLRMLASYHLTRKFKGVYGLDTICATGKTAIGRKLIEENALNLNTTLLVGDTLHDAEVAECLGIKCICYAGGHNESAPLAAKAAVITSLTEILPLFIV